MNQKPVVPTQSHFCPVNPKPFKRGADVASTWAKFGYVPPSQQRQK
jgi:hypothetical protein